MVTGAYSTRLWPSAYALGSSVSRVACLMLPVSFLFRSMRLSMIFLLDVASPFLLVSSERLLGTGMAITVNSGRPTPPGRS